MKFKGYFVEDIPRRKFLEVGLKGGIAIAATPSLLMQLLSCKGSKPASAKLALDPQILNRTIKKALEKAGLTIGQIELIEVQEAFAAQVLADLKEMGLGPKDYDRVNVNGSGISLGHPIACTGTRVLVTLLYEMRRRDARYGLECICGGGGLGIAAVFEREG